MSFKITSPIPGFSEPSVFGPLTLTFVDGVAEAEEIPAGMLAYLERTGYTVEEVSTQPDGAPDESWTASQLKDWLTGHGIELKGAKKKAELLALIPTEADGNADAEGKEAGDAA